MKITPQEFRAHLDEMLKDGQIKQAGFWVENGLFVYANYDEIMDIYDEEYRDRIEQ